MTTQQKNLFHAYRGTLLTALGLLLAYLLLPVLTPFFAAGILAYICDPLVDQLCALKLGKFQFSRTQGTSLALAFLLLILLFLCMIIIPLLQKELLLIAERAPIYFNHLQSLISPWLKTHFNIDFVINAAQIQHILLENWQRAGGLLTQFISFAGSKGLAFFGFIMNLLMIPIVLFYLLRDWDTLIAQIGDLIPRKQLANVRQIAHEIDLVLAEFLRGQLGVMLVMSLFYLAGLWLCKLELFLPIALITGLLGFVPYFGVALGLMLALLSGWLEFNETWQLLPILAVFGLGQVLESMVVTPKLVGERIGLHPVMVIFALLAGAQLFGFAGVLLALPAAAAIAVYLRHAKSQYLASDTFLN